MLTHLQIATDSDVFVVDLLAFAGSPEALTQALGPTLSSDRVYKVGWELTGSGWLQPYPGAAGGGTLGQFVLTSV